MMFTISLPLSSFLLLVSLVMLLVIIIYSWILIYHWHTYGQSKAITTGTTALYLVGVAGCIIGMATAISMTV
jgi:uncharacterized membrane protein YqjE